STDEFRSHQFELLVQVLAAIAGLVRQGRAVTGRPAFENIADINLFTLHAAGRDDAVEQLPGGADERPTCGIFIGPRCLADEAKLRVELALAKDGLCP